MTWHPELPLRTLQSTSLDRACGFNKSQVTHFYKLLGDLLAENNLQPTWIFNMDESGLAVIQKGFKIFAGKGEHQVGTITSQKGQSVTIICAKSAAGEFVPPGMIYPRMRMKNELKNGVPPGTKFYCQVVFMS